MKKSIIACACLLAVAAMAALGTARARAAADPAGWNPKAAAAYLDERQDWWQKWPGAARDHGTFCVSCHTAATYALARPALRRTLGETEPSASERALTGNVSKRVMMWKDVEPFYPDQTRGLPKTSESRGTEAVLNALVLSSRDARGGGALGDDTRRAFENMWALQFTRGDQTGSWAWLNFHYEPWEADGSRYYGSALAAIAIGMAPAGYAKTPDIQDGINRLRDYLSKGADQQHLFNRLTALWASTTWSGGPAPSDASATRHASHEGRAEADAILSPQQHRAIVDDVLKLQQADGGWSMSTLASWKRVDNTPLETGSDGYATGLIAYVLEASGDAAARAPIDRALAWLQKNQAASGSWYASSLNKQRDPASDAARFMSDAATAYAVLALATSR